MKQIVVQGVGEVEVVGEYSASESPNVAVITKITVLDTRPLELLRYVQEWLEKNSKT